MTKKAEVQETEDDIIEEEVETEESEEIESKEEAEAEESEDPEKKPESEDESEDDDDEVIVTIGDEAPPQEEEQAQAPEWVRELRKAHRETQKENRELRDKLKAMENPEPKAVQVGQKPKLEDFDYDTEKYEQELTAWYERKRKADEASAQQKAEQQKAEEAWQQKLNEYGESKAKLKVKDFDDAEAVVLEAFSQTQQGIVVQGADNSALVIYALGKNPDRAKELASIKDPVKFAFAVAKLEKDLKVKNRKAPPPPEKKVDGTGPKSGAVDSTLERLRAEAAKTGNYDKVMAYRRKQKAKG
jgi:hypothetical protein